MINLNDNYSQKEFKFFLKDFLPEDYEEKNSKLHIEETHKFFKKAVLLGSVRSLNDLKIIEVADLINAHHNRDPVFTDFEEGYQIQLIIDAVKKSSKYKRWVKV